MLTKHNISPHPLKNYPGVFCINEYIVLLYDQNGSKRESYLINQEFCELPKEVFDGALDNIDDEQIRITFISDEDFLNFQKQTHNAGAKMKLNSIAKEEFIFALKASIPGIQIDPKHLFLDSHVTEEQKNVVFGILTQTGNWNEVTNRIMTNFKILEMPIPNRRGKPVKIQVGLLEIKNSDGKLYYRLGFYGNVN